MVITLTSTTKRIDLETKQIFCIHILIMDPPIKSFFEYIFTELLILSWGSSLGHFFFNSLILLPLMKTKAFQFFLLIFNIMSKWCASSECSKDKSELVFAPLSTSSQVITKEISDLFSQIPKDSVELKIESLLSNGLSISAKDDKGFTLLHLASAKGWPGAVKYLIDQGASLDEVTNKGSTPLHLASFYGNKDVVTLLVGKNANLNAKNHSGTTPLLMACRNGQLEVGLILVKHGACIQTKDNSGISPILAAIQNKQIQFSNFLIQKGACVRDVCDKGLSTLCWASSLGAHEMMINLVSKGALVNYQDIDGNTALHRACLSSENEETVRNLIELGASVNIQCKEKLTPLHHACESNSLQIADHLIKKGASINCSDSNDLTPLFYAIQKSHKEVAKLLIDYGADLNLTYLDGYTALSCACSNSCIEIVHLLLKNGASANLRSAKGCSPLHLASLLDNVEVAHILITQGADINSTDDNLRSAVHVAAANGNRKMLRHFYINFKIFEVDFNMVDKFGKSPLMLAIENDQFKTAELLIRIIGARLDIKDVNGFGPFEYALLKKERDLLTLIFHLQEDKLDLKIRLETLESQLTEDGICELISFLLTCMDLGDIFNFSHTHNQIEGGCSICLGNESRFRATAECNHTFHAHCIFQWLSINQTCPICRSLLLEISTD